MKLKIKRNQQKPKAGYMKRSIKLKTSKQNPTKNKQTKSNREETQIANIRIEKGAITINPTDIKRI